MIQLANFEERTFYVMLGKVVTSVDVTFTFQMTEEEFTATLTPISSTLRASKFTFQATSYPEGQYIVEFVETGKAEVLVTVAGFVSGNPIFATSQYNTYNDDGTSTTYVPSDDQGLVPSVSQKLRVSTIDQATDVSYVRYLKVTNGTLIDNGDNSVTLDTGGGGAESLNDLTDVIITAPLATGQTLVYDHGANPRGFHNIANSLANLSDTNITTTPSPNAFLRYVSGAWEAVPVSIPSPPPSTTDGLPEGSTNLYYTEARVSANSDVTANTAKTGITQAQADAIVANTAKVGITTQQANDITANNAKVGITTQQATEITLNTAKNSYPSADATKLAGIETGAQVNTVDSVNTQTGAVVLDTDDVSEGASNLYYTETRVSANSSVVANTAKNSYPTADATKLAGIAAGAEVNVNADWNATSGDAQILNKPSIPSNIGDLGDVPASLGTSGQVLAVNAGGTALEYSNVTSAPYEEDSIVSDQNVTMNTGVSVASNKIVDIMSDALADTSNANTKKFLGFHTGSGTCVLKGMVDANNSISGATAGSPLWLGASGAFSATAPTTATYYSRVVGYYIGTLIGGEVMCYFDPSKDWVQID